MAIFQLGIKVSRREILADSLLYALSRPHGACAYPVRLYLRVQEVYGLKESGRFLDALRAADSLLVPHSLAMRPHDVALVQYYKGEILWHLERYVEAGALMKAARRFYSRETSDYLKTATINGGLGYYYREAGDTLSALCAFEHAFATIKKGGDYLNMVVVRRKILEGLLSIETNPDPDKACLDGEIRRRPANDDGQREILLIILILFLAAATFVVAWAWSHSAILYRR